MASTEFNDGHYSDTTAIVTLSPFIGRLNVTKLGGGGKNTYFTKTAIFTSMSSGFFGGFTSQI
jgi:hypothetical protein